MEALKKDRVNDAIAIKAGLETWFDEAMARVEGSYKRWVTAWLFGIGLLLAITLNLSTTGTAADLWHDPVTRQAVADSADKLLEDGATAEELKTVASTADGLTQVGIPVGWNHAARDVWTNGDGWGIASDLVGWLLTASLVMLGAPFWFDLLGRLISIRGGSGPKPPAAANDDASATTQSKARTEGLAAATPQLPAALAGTAAPPAGQPPAEQPPPPPAPPAPAGPVAPTEVAAVAQQTAALTQATLFPSVPAAVSEKLLVPETEVPPNTN
jgi:hypothetical protein